MRCKDVFNSGPHVVVTAYVSRLSTDAAILTLLADTNIYGVFCFVICSAFCASEPNKNKQMNK